MKPAVFHIVCLSCVLFFCSPLLAAESIAKAPYISALTIHAATGDVLFEDNEDAPVYPASVLKLMDLYIVLTRIEEGKLSLGDMVQVTPEAARMGGSQVYLDPKEQFSVEELLYALMVQSANDAATALAIHIAGSEPAFIDLMNATAKQLGMNSTTFHTEHGLPPGKGQEPDVTTARDMAILCRELVKRPEALKYTSTTTRGFRNDTFTMRNHNHLLGKPPGIDGLKTGYFQRAGFSIATTAQKDGQRLITLVMGSADRKERDAKALELMGTGFAQLPAAPATAQTVPAGQTDPATVAGASLAPAAAPANGQEASGGDDAQQSNNAGSSSGWGTFFLGLGVGLLAFIAIILVAGRFLQRRKDGNQYLHRR